MKTGRWVVALCGLVILNALVWRAEAAPPSVTVEPLAVEKGSAVLVVSPTGARVLVGAGADASVLRGLGKTLLPWQRSLAALVLPNLSPGTVGGAPLLLGRYRVGFLARAAFPGTAAAERALTNAESAGGLRPLTLAPGARLFIGCGAVITFASAPRGLAATLVYGETRVPLASTTPPGRYAQDGTVRP